MEQIAAWFLRPFRRCGANRRHCSFLRHPDDLPQIQFLTDIFQTTARLAQNVSGFGPFRQSMPYLGRLPTTCTGRLRGLSTNSLEFPAIKMHLSCSSERSLGPHARTGGGHTFSTNSTSCAHASGPAPPGAVIELGAKGALFVSRPTVMGYMHPRGHAGIDPGAVRGGHTGSV